MLKEANSKIKAFVYSKEELEELVKELLLNHLFHSFEVIVKLKETDNILSVDIDETIIGEDAYRAYSVYTQELNKLPTVYAHSLLYKLIQDSLHFSGNIYEIRHLVTKYNQVMIFVEQLN